MIPESDTDAALAVLVASLRAVPLFEKDADGDYINALGGYESDPSPAADTARVWAAQLLSAANANGLGGCRLCRS